MPSIFALASTLRLCLDDGVEDPGVDGAVLTGGGFGGVLMVGKDGKVGKVGKDGRDGKDAAS